MPNYTGKEVMDYARVYLNDVPGNQWNDLTLLPYLRLSWDELQVELQSRDIQAMDEVTSDISVPVDFNEIEAPINLISPLNLYEKQVGAPDDEYVLMAPRAWESSFESQGRLNYWTWRNDKFYFPPHTAAAEVRVHYIKALLDIIDDTQQLTINNCRIVLAKRTAGLAARYGNSNPTRADLLDQEALYFLHKIAGIEVKQKQNTQATRRRGYRSRPVSTRY